MNKYYLIAIFLSCFYHGIGQTTDDILTTKTYREGIYMSFNEFRTNSPSILTEVYPISDKDKNSKEDDSPYSWYYKNKRGKEKSIGNNAWGFCRGDKIYFLKKAFPINYFLPMVFTGRYCYAIDNINIFIQLFSDMEEEELSESDIKILERSRIPYTEDVLININNGKDFLLTKEVLITIIEDDPELYEKFKNDPEGLEKRVSYILNYNTRHQDQIKDLK